MTYEAQLLYTARILLAGACGAAIGFERENRRKPAGFRTHILVGIAAALMMITSKYGFQDVIGEYVRLDPSRMAAGVVTAIGFLGSGVIFLRNKTVSGITTSAGIWATVGVGLSIGAGMFMIGLMSTSMILIVELFFGRGGIYAMTSSSGISFLSAEIEGGQTELKALKHQIEEQNFKIKKCLYTQKEDGLLKADITLLAPSSKNTGELMEIRQEWLKSMKLRGELK